MFRLGVKHLLHGLVAHHAVGGQFVVLLEGNHGGTCGGVEGAGSLALKVAQLLEAFLHRCHGLAFAAFREVPRQHGHGDGFFSFSRFFLDFVPAKGVRYLLHERALRFRSATRQEQAETPKQQRGTDEDEDIKATVGEVVFPRVDVFVVDHAADG